MNICLVGSSGGHLAHIMNMKSFWQKHDRFFVTFKLPDTKDLGETERCYWAYHPTTRNIPNLLKNFVLALKVISKEKPDLVLTTGAGVALPFFIIGKIFGAKTIYIEVYDRIDYASLTTKLCKPFTDSLLVQWEEQLEFSKDAQLIGRLM